MRHVAIPQRLRCKVGWHRWATRVNGNVRYQECAHCGKYRKEVATLNRFPPGGTGDGGAAG